MVKFKEMLPYLFATAIAFYFLPMLGRDTGSFMLILLVAIPLICFAAAFMLGSGKGFSPTYPFAVGLLFIPSIFIYYNSTALTYVLIYTLVALAGNSVGSILVRKN